MKALIAIALFATSAPVLAAAAGENTGAGQPKQERMICRRIEALSGSHVSRTRICHTAAQWRAMRDSSVDDQMDAMSAISSPNDMPTDGYTSSRGVHDGGPAAPR
jgi:hypothetical protein